MCVIFFSLINNSYYFLEMLLRQFLFILRKRKFDFGLSNHITCEKSAPAYTNYKTYF